MISTVAGRITRTITGSRYRYLARRSILKVPRKAKLSVEEAIEKILDSTECTPGKATYIVNINLNVSRALKGHVLEGCFDLIHGSGKKIDVAALTTNEDLALSALQAGAKYAGDICDSITHKIIRPQKNYERIKQDNTFHRIVATTEMEDACTGKGLSLRQKLKRQKMFPSVAERTLVEPDDFVEAVRKHVHGSFVPFKTSLDGIVSVPIGKFGVHTVPQVKENLDCVLQKLYSIRPRNFGTGDFARVKHAGKFVIGITLNATPVGMGTYELDLVKTLKSVDNTELYEENVFRTYPPMDKQRKREYLQNAADQAFQWWDDASSTTSSSSPSSTTTTASSSSA